MVNSRLSTTPGQVGVEMPTLLPRGPRGIGNFNNTASVQLASRISDIYGTLTALFLWLYSQQSTLKDFSATMSDHNVLNTVLDGTQVPYQPFVVIVDSAVFSGLPLFRESLRRALNR